MADHSEMIPMGESFASLSLLEKAVFVGVMMPALIVLKLCSTLVSAVMGRAWCAGTPWLERAAEDVYIANGWMTWFPSFGLTMSIVRLHSRDGGRTNELMLHGAIFFNEDLACQIQELGEVRYISVPSAFHDSFAMDWKRRFPEAIVICSADALDEISKGVEVDKSTEQALAPFDVSLHDPTPFLRSAIGERVLEVPTGEVGECKEETRALIFSDVMQNNPPTCLMTMLPLGWSGLRVARFFKFMIVKDREGLHSFLVDLCRNTQRLELAVFGHAHEPVRGLDTPQRIATAAKKHCSSTLHY